MRRAEAGERRHEVDAAVVVDSARERLALACAGEQTEAVLQPLDRRAGDEDGPFERVLVVAGGRSGDDPVRRNGRSCSRVGEHEVAGAVRRLRLTGVETAVAEEGRLLVAGDPRDRGTHAGKLAVAYDLARPADPR